MLSPVRTLLHPSLAMMHLMEELRLPLTRLPLVLLLPLAMMLPSPLLLPQTILHPMKTVRDSFAMGS